MVMLMIKLTIDERIKESGLKKIHVAKQVGVDPDTLRNWEQNKFIPKLDQAVKLAKVLGCKLEDLFENDNG